ncbi:MAG: M23 family metallopeptidase [Eubacteriales bacterium]|nr:M23 family metallopeptidase [Eubacteriales bacterium]
MTRRRRKSPQAVLGVIFCIPIAFIVYFAISYSSLNITPESVRSVSLTIPSGEQYTYDSDEQIGIFVNAMLDSKKISTPIRDISGESPITIQFDRGDKILRYKLYPQLNLTGCMVIDPDGSMFLLTNDTAKSLLIRSELQYLYNDYFLPTLSVVSGENINTVLPESYTWLYKKVDNNYYSDNMTGTYDENSAEIISIYPNLNSFLKFSVEPSEVAYSFITDEQEYISELSYLSFTEDTEITVSITAKWSDVGAPDFYGEATYSFPLLYDIPAEIEMFRTEFNAGDAAVLNIRHLNENEQITIESQLITSETIEYTFTDKNTTVALLPISEDNTAGTYTIVFTVSGASYSYTVNVSKTDTEPVFVNVAQEVYDAMLSEVAVRETNERLAAVFTKAGKEAYYSLGETFTAPVSGTVLSSYGKSELISVDATTRKILGTVYSVPDGTAVKAAQKGVVVFAESLPSTGNTLIIDHGYGVMTCYFNLKGFDSVVGDSVLQGEIIGRSGSTGFTDGKSILTFSVAVNGVFINPAEFTG